MKQKVKNNLQNNIIKKKKFEKPEKFHIKFSPKLIIELDILF